MVYYIKNLSLEEKNRTNVNCRLWRKKDYRAKYWPNSKNKVGEIILYKRNFNSNE